ncbi:hypothetical protein [Spiroplasma endosymbiont of Virgichneumon dumeticola]|uniref:hypothetical protein n=1 Tax=Spiroplasma endosymbiont of Virgichneumon dumeticola TaxID=3139323 RepID=UPI0035C91890
MKKNILKTSICIDEIEKVITKNKDWEIIEKKYDFYQPYVSTFDKLNYETKIDLYISFKTKTDFNHKIYCYFLDFDEDNVFKISDIKSQEHPHGQKTTRIADFKYYNTTGNLGFTAYHSPVKGQEYNLSHNYQSFFDTIVAKEKDKELNYVCILLKYHNHAQNKKLLRYYVNSYKKFISSFLLKIERFETKKIRALEKQTTKLIGKTNRKKVKEEDNLPLKLSNGKKLKYNLNDEKLYSSVIKKQERFNEK